MSIFNNSFIFSVIYKIYIWLVEIVSGSFAYSLIKRVFKAVMDSFSESRFNIIITNAISWLKNKFEHSFFYSFIDVKNAKIHFSFEESFFYKIIESLVLGLSFILKFLFARSNLVRIPCEWIFNNFHITLGLFITFASVIPHRFWNNMMIVAFAVGLLSAYLIAKPKEEITRALKSINVTFYLFMLLTLLAAITSFEPQDSIKYGLFSISSLLICILIIINIKDKETLVKTLYFFIFSMLLISIYGIYQQKFGLNSLLTSNNVLTDGITVKRAYSTMDNPNNFAEYLIMLLPVTFALFLNSKSAFKKFVLAICLVIPAYVLILTYSRSAWIGVVCAIGILILLYDWRYLPFMVLALMMVFPFLPSTITARIFSIFEFGKDTSYSHREKIWEGVASMLRDHWFHGIGLGYEPFAKIYNINMKWGILNGMPFAKTMNDFYYTNALHAHNVFLEVWLEMGIFGILSLLALLVKSFFTSIYASFKATDKELKNILFAYIGTFVGILFMGMVEYIWFYTRIMMFFWIFIALFISTANIILNDNKNLAK